MEKVNVAFLFMELQRSLFTVNYKA